MAEESPRQGLARPGARRGSNDERRTRVFISYSRRDLDFAERLVAALDARGFQAYLDKKDILPGEPWKERLGALILDADAVAFVITPDSIASEVCGWEVAETERLEKKLLPVVNRAVEGASVPPRLARRNYIFLRAEDDFDIGVGTLASAIDTDITWIRQHTRMGELARRWEEAGRRVVGGRLLRGEELADAERWLLASPKSAPDPTEAQRAYIQASRAFEAAEIEREKAQIAKTRRFQKRASWALGGVAFLLAAALAGVVWQDVRTTKREQAVFSSQSTEALKDARFEYAMRLALNAVPERGGWPWTPSSTELEGKLGGGAFSSRLRAALIGHSGSIHAAAISPDGTRVATASEDKTARLWDAATGAEIATLKGHDGEVRDIAFSPDGESLATASYDQSVRTWDARTGLARAVLRGHTSPVFSVAFSPDGSLIATASGDGTARLWDAKSGSEIVVLRSSSDLEEAVWAAVFSPDGRRVLTASKLHGARLWDIETKEEIASFASDRDMGWQPAFSPDGGRVATLFKDRTLHVWDVATRAELFVLKPQKDARRSASSPRFTFSPDGSRIVAAWGDHTARVWDAANGAELAILNGHDDSVVSARFSPDGQRIATSSFDGTARLWDAKSGSEVAVLKGHRNWTNDVIFSADGKLLVTWSSDATARVWSAEDLGVAVKTPGAHMFAGFAFGPDGLRIVLGDLPPAGQARPGLFRRQPPAPRAVRVFAATGGSALTLNGHMGAISGAAFSQDRRRVATASEDGTTRIWDAQDGRQTAILEEQAAVRSVAFSRDGSRVVTASGENTARVWDAESGKEIVALKGHTYFVSHAAFSPDGKRIATASGDSTARVWDAATGRELTVFKDHTYYVDSAVFSADGKHVLTASSDRTARLWDAETGAAITIFKGHGDGLWTASFSPDGKRIVTASSDETARLWDAVSGAEIAVLAGHGGAVKSAVFSADGRQVATATFGARVRLWDVSWAADNYGSKLRDRVCAEKLIGVQGFTDEQLADPILSGIDKNDPVARNPCLRRGPLHWEYYTQAIGRWGRWFAWQRSSSGHSAAARP